MAGPGEGFVSAGRRTIHYRAVRGGGRRPAVMLVHGMGQTSAAWREVMDLFGDRADVVAIDLHGVGGTSPWPGTRKLGLEDEAELVFTAAAELFGDRPFHIVGHGYGAAVALCANVIAPDALASVTLVDILSIGLFEKLEPDSDALTATQLQRDRFSQWMVRGEATEAMSLWAAHYLGPTVWPWLERDARRELIGLAGATLHQWQALTSDRTSLADLRSLKAPLLILCGSKTPPSEARLAQLLHGHAPVGRFELLPGAGHDSLTTHPTMLAGTWARHWLDRGTLQLDRGAAA